MLPQQDAQQCTELYVFVVEYYVCTILKVYSCFCFFYCWFSTELLCVLYSNVHCFQTSSNMTLYEAWCAMAIVVQ